MEQGEKRFTDKGEHVAACDPPGDRRIADAREDGLRLRAAAAGSRRHRTGEREEPPHALGQPLPIDLDAELRAPRQHRRKKREQSAIPAGKDARFENYLSWKRRFSNLFDDALSRRDPAPELPFAGQRDVQRAVGSSRVL